ncbi:MAG: hypothetical protein WA021_03420 [Minisyncoccia bacterium]
MTLNERIQFVERCTGPTSPSFYRTLYAISEAQPLTIASEDEWRALPFVTKDDMIATPYSNRVFANRASVDHIRASSGTSGKPPLFSPRTYLRDMEYRTKYHDFKKGILAYGVPAAPYWHEHFQMTLGNTPRVIVFDPQQPAASVRLARIANVDCISTFAFHMRLIGEHMMTEKIHTQIRLIEICGEACTPALFAYLRATFPHATIIPFYGSSEVEDSPIGVPCRPITGEEPLSLYHAKKNRFHEIIDPETGAVLPVCADAEGELVITAYPGEPSAFPLIRYRTGDVIRVVDERCPQHQTWSFTIVGRATLDFLKIPGGVLRVDEILRVVRLFQGRISERFELHRFERETPAGPKPQVELHVDPVGVIDMEKLASEVAAALRVNPTRSYAQGVADGLYLPLTCVILAPGQTVKKTKRLVAH